MINYNNFGDKWMEIASKKGFRFESPFTIEYDGRSIIVLGRLSSIQSGRTIIIDFITPPSFEVDESIIRYCRSEGFEYSFFNIETFISDCNGAIIDAMNEWAL